MIHNKSITWEYTATNLALLYLADHQKSCNEQRKQVRIGRKTNYLLDHEGKNHNKELQVSVWIFRLFLSNTNCISNYVELCEKRKYTTY